LIDVPEASTSRILVHILKSISWFKPVQFYIYNFYKAGILSNTNYLPLSSVIVLYVLVRLVLPSNTKDVTAGKCFNTELVPLYVTTLVSYVLGPNVSSPLRAIKSALYKLFFSSCSQY
jgi:hypothetical protein